MVLPPLDSFKSIRMPLNDCICGGDDIAVAESFTLGIQTYAIIKCNKCGRGIKRRTYKKAEEVWNKNNPKDVVEVKHGEWHLLDECANEGVYCSVCHKKVYRKDYANQKLKSKFCPNCGADMRGEK